MNRFNRRLCACLAIWALVWAALAPALAQVVKAEQGWVQVCGASGVAWVAVPAAEASDDSQAPAVGTTVECPWCLHLGAHWGLPVGPTQPQVWPQTGAVTVAHTPQVPHSEPPCCR